MVLDGDLVGFEFGVPGFSGADAPGVVEES